MNLSRGPDWKYLPDARRGLNETQVFVIAEVTPPIASVPAAIKLLRDQMPLRLVPISEPPRTVVFLASANPQIRVGRSVPSPDRNADIAEILEVLESNGIECQVEG